MGCYSVLCNEREECCGFMTEKVENRSDSALRVIFRVSSRQHGGTLRCQRRQGETRPGSTM